jgi:hypothetical protein
VSFSIARLPTNSAIEPKKLIYWEKKLGVSDISDGTNGGDGVKIVLHIFQESSGTNRLGLFDGS